MSNLDDLNIQSRNQSPPTITKNDRKMITINADNHKLLKLYAFENDLSIKDVADRAIEEYFKNK